ncbi:AraC family transcriptional regulator [Sporosarcina thermotolerans]|uniref:AraC family transcriptional regulator n=1 Tax=Sporosarcina thermotolerans TaxID=633404 RepID=UPI0024BBEF6C|nr:AraC family transcriptional regulator [Sporosarcina thermotolerans]WHT46850.1 AraC family transcriptional regulator [Sporosarcina thermotolerans]
MANLVGNTVVGEITMEVKTIASFECGIIEKEYQLVGQSITANFPKGFPDAAIKVQMDFERRMDEIANSKSKQVLFSPYMSNGIFATYFPSLEVDELNEIPDGMMGLELPLMKYAKICCSNRTIDQGYSKLFAWMGRTDINKTSLTTLVQSKFSTLRMAQRKKLLKS